MVAEESLLYLFKLPDSVHEFSNNVGADKICTREQFSENNKWSYLAVSHTMQEKDQEALFEKKTEFRKLCQRHFQA